MFKGSVIGLCVLAPLACIGINAEIGGLVYMGALVMWLYELGSEIGNAAQQESAGTCPDGFSSP